MILSEFQVHSLGVKNVKLGIRLEKNTCQKKADKIQRKQTGYHITIKRHGQKNSQTIKVDFTMAVKVMTVIMMMRFIMKIMNSSSYLRVLSIIATKLYHQFFYKNLLTILPSASTVMVHFYLLRMQLVATVLEECGT